MTAVDLSGLERCIHCGICLEACPTYRLTRLETESPRGRLHLMGAIADGRVAPQTSAAVLHLDRCLACRACEAVCPSGVPYGRLIEATRAGITSARPLPPLALLLLRVVAHPSALALAARLLAFADRIGLRRAARRFLSPSLRRLDDLAPPVGDPSFRPVAVDAPRAKVALLLGCVMRVSYGEVHRATARVLAHAGVAVVDVAGQACCGALHAHAGDVIEATRLAKRNIAAFESSGAELLVVNAAGCGAHLKAYGELLENDERWRERAAAFSRKVRDLTEYLAAASQDVSFGALRIRVTYQDPCHLAHAQGIRSEPRLLLGRVAGLELVEMTDADACCGSAGYYNITQPDYADRLLGPKIDAILATGADVVVTANPGCMLQLEAGLRSRGRREIAVRHIAEILDRAIANA